MIDNNMSVLSSGTNPHLTLGKCWNAFSAGGWLHFEHIPGMENPANILMKPLPWFSLKDFFEPLLQWKGDRVDDPLSTSDPERSDTGPGSTVPDEQLSHERDSARVSEHAILHGNELAVLDDAMPTDIEFSHSVQFVMTFDFTWIQMDFTFAHLPSSLFAAMDKGLITLIQFQMPDS